MQTCIFQCGDVKLAANGTVLLRIASPTVVSSLDFNNGTKGRISVNTSPRRFVCKTEIVTSIHTTQDQIIIQG